MSLRRVRVELTARAKLEPSTTHLYDFPVMKAHMIKALNFAEQSLMDCEL
jgi:hypothetical protein